MSGFKINFPGNKKVDVEFYNFIIRTDQSRENGGDESAPEPFDVFIASIGACAGIYAKSFCDIRKIDTSAMNLFVDVVFKEGKKLMDQINISLHVDSDFPAKYEKPIIKAMSSCAVKNQLHPDIKVVTTVVRK